MRFVGYWTLLIRYPFPSAFQMLVVMQEGWQSYCYSPPTRTSLHLCAVVCLKLPRLFASAIGASKEDSAYSQYTIYCNRLPLFLTAKFGKTLG
jgi:hypothetical protein